MRYGFAIQLFDISADCAELTKLGVHVHTTETATRKRTIGIGYWTAKKCRTLHNAIGL